jgi:hypothetical protein
MVDVFLYNGEIRPGEDCLFIEMIENEKSSNTCLLILVTPGGSPDAAYKIARHIQNCYEYFVLLVSGMCKSAGTLLAIGASELAFMPYGELGPLDVQMAKTDQIAGLESGLNISEAFLTLEKRARDTYSNMIVDIVNSSGGVVSFQTASHAATEIIGAMYGPIFSRIDPEEVGSRSRAMRIGEDYGKRLDLKWSNLKPNALEMLSRSYPSHGFVIDKNEAANIFQNVRYASAEEISIVKELGILGLYPQVPQKNSVIRKIHPANAPVNDTNLQISLDEGHKSDEQNKPEKDDVQQEIPRPPRGSRRKTRKVHG